MFAVYRQLFAVPGVWRPVAGKLINRTAEAMVPLALLLLVQDATGSLTAAGAAVGAVAVGAGAGLPWWGRVADARGQRAVLSLLSVLFGLALTLPVLLAVVGAPAWALIASGLAVGATQPPVSPAIRSMWDHLLAPPLRPVASAFEAATSELP